MFVFTTFFCRVIIITIIAVIVIVIATTIINYERAIINLLNKIWGPAGQSNSLTSIQGACADGDVVFQGEGKILF